MDPAPNDSEPRLPPGPLRLQSLAAVLLDNRVISAAQYRQLRTLEHSLQSADGHLLGFIAAQRFASPALAGAELELDSLVDWLAEHLGVRRYHIDPLKVDVAAITAQCSYEYARGKGILALDVQPQRVLFGTCEPCDFSWVDELSRLLNCEIDTALVDPVSLARYQAEFYSLARTVSGASREQLGAAVPAQSFEQMMELGARDKLDANDSHVIGIVDWLLQYAYEQRASDIHLEPRREQTGVRFRIDGCLHAVYDMPPAVGLAVLSRLKILGRMDVSEKRKPQDGRIKTRDLGGREVELRLSTMPTAFGEKLVMRVFNPELLDRDIADLGFRSSQRRGWLEMLARPNGIVLVTGPTGSGKTSTLYASLKHLARPEVNVCTIEDPIEQMEPALNQMQVQPQIDLDFAAGVRTLLRQDPDVIMIGEIRDPPTAAVAVQAALTGHLVLSTMHTNDAPSAVARLMELGVPAYLINATVIGVLGQRLLRTLCPDCKVPSSIEEAQWREFIEPWQAAAPSAACAPVGCLRCRNSGFRGRSAIYELLPLGDALRALVREGADLQALRKCAWRKGMRPLRIAGALRAGEGLTTLSEVLKVAPIAV